MPSGYPKGKRRIIRNHDTIIAAFLGGMKHVMGHTDRDVYMIIDDGRIYAARERKKQG